MYMNTWFLNKMISLKFSADGTNWIRDYSEFFGTGHIRDSGHEKVCPTGL
jgi:hypothetical protein